MTKKPIEEELAYVSKKEYGRNIEDEKIKAEEFHNVVMRIFEERHQLKKLHHMRCPQCGMKLIEIDYKRVKVDKCSECDGIWLDSGEIETISKMEKTIIDKFFRTFKRQKINFGFLV